jgi:protein N-terminal methyltransferase
VVCLKENTCQDTDFVLDKNDASVTRSVPYLLHLAERAGLRVVLQRHQNNFPEEIFPVPMIALEPASRVHE